MPPELVDRWCGDGSLPEIARLRREGRLGAVVSAATLFPASVWPTFVSGIGVADHGIFHAIQWDPDEMRLRTTGSEGWATVRPFWHDLAAAGVPTISLDVPFSWHREGHPLATEVQGWGSHEGLREESRPAGLLADIRRRFGRSSMARDVRGLKSPSWLARELRGLVSDVERRGRLSEYLLTHFDWRVAIATFAEVHRAGHWFWSARTTGVAQGGLKAVVVAVDKEVGRLRRLLRADDHLVVFSVHGMGEGSDADRFGEVLWAALEPELRQTARRRLDPVGLLRGALPVSVLRELSARLPKSTYRRFHEHHLNAGRDWSRFKTIALPPEVSYFFRANIRGREREGRLPPEEAEAHLDWLTEELAGVRTLDGSPMFASFHRVRGKYKGHAEHLLPDLIASPEVRAFGKSIRLRSGEEVWAPLLYEKDGQHQAEGFYIQTGPGIPQGWGPTLDGRHLASFFLGAAGLGLPGRQS